MKMGISCCTLLGIFLGAEALAGSVKLESLLDYQVQYSISINPSGPKNWDIECLSGKQKRAAFRLQGDFYTKKISEGLMLVRAARSDTCSPVDPSGYRVADENKRVTRICESEAKFKQISAFFFGLQQSCEARQKEGR